MKRFSTILCIFWKFDFLKEIWHLTKLVKPFTILNCAKKIFLANLFILSPKEVFLHNYRHFWKIDFFKEIRQALTFQKYWNLLLSLIVLRKYFFAKLFILSSKEVFLHHYRQFWKIDFLKKIRQARTLTKIEKI